MNNDMATMPIPDLVDSIRTQLVKQNSSLGTLVIMILNILCNRLENLYKENLDLKDKLQTDLIEVDISTNGC